MAKKPHFAKASRGARISFYCPQHKRLMPREEIAFLCNHCAHDEMVFQNEMYICKRCFKPGENFECLLCGSKNVEMRRYGKG